jgi:hypothetical protein
MGYSIMASFAVARNFLRKMKKDGSVGGLSAET